MEKPLEMIVFGSDQPCPSCIHSPSSIETKEWLEAAIQRKFPNHRFIVRYVDIDHPHGEKEKKYVQRIFDDELFYPLVVLGDEVISEGDPQLKRIFYALEQQGFRSN